MIKLYTMPGCAQCLMLKSLLNKKHIAFEEIEDMDQALEVGAAHGIMGAPILVAEDGTYGFPRAIKWIDAQ